MREGREITMEVEVVVMQFGKRGRNHKPRSASVLWKLRKARKWIFL